MQGLSRQDVTRFVRSAGRLPARSQALIDGLLAITSGDAPPFAAAEALAHEVSRRSGAVVSRTALRQQVKRLNQVLAKNGAPFHLVGRAGSIGIEPTAKWDDDAITASLRETLKEHSGEKLRGDLDGLVPPRALPDELLVMFSYAWLEGQQQAVQLEFYDRLRAELARPPENYCGLPRLSLWRDEERINPADKGTPQMDEACSRAFLGLLMLSSKYPHSAACMREAEYFVDDVGNNKRGKRCIALRVNTRLSEVPQRFKAGSRIVLSGPGDAHLLRFWTTGNEADRQDFVRDLALRIFANAQEWCSTGSPATVTSESLRLQPVHTKTRKFFEARTDQLPHDEGHSVKPRARPGPAGYSLADTAEIDEMGGLQIVDHLVNWARSGGFQRPRLAALLGDFGMGKTVTCQLVTRRLLELAAVDPQSPLPIYFDLRDVRRPSDVSGITLEAMMGEMLERSGERAPSAADVIRFVRDEGAVVIFDGLDEITNKLPPEAAKRVYRELLGIVPAHVWNEDSRRRREKINGRFGPSILISCRSQYFSDFAAERSFLTDSDRSGLDPRSDMAAYVMLPFSAEQVKEYLEKNLDGKDSLRALALLDETYDLGELAKRPILLRYISEMVHRLEEEKISGRPINISVLYDIIVEQAFQRDDPKHVIRIVDKRKLLRALAAFLHSTGQDEISNFRLTEWLDREISARHPRLALATSGIDGLSQSEIFLQDLRNATLLSRPAETGFRFGHTSLREYFLADELYRSVQDGRGAETWDLPPPTAETITFLLRRHEVEPRHEQDSFNEKFPRLLEAGAPQRVRETAFRVWRQGIAEGIRLVRPTEMDCSGFNLWRAQFVGRAGQLYPLSKTRWKGARLRQAQFESVDLSGAQFDEVDASAASFVSCDLADAQFNDCQLQATRWRHCRLESEAIVNADVEAAEAHQSFRGGVAWRPQPAMPQTPWRHQRSYGGYGLNSISSGWIDGRQVIVTSSTSGTIRLWDLKTGSVIRTLSQTEYGSSAAYLAGEGGKVKVLAFHRGTISCWSADTGERERDIASGVRNGSFKVSEVGSRKVASWVEKKRVLKTVDASTLQEMHSLRLNADITAHALVELNGTFVAAVSTPKSGIQLYDLHASSLLCSIEPVAKRRESLTAAVVEGTAYLLCLGEDLSLHVWDLNQMEMVAHHSWTRYPDLPPLIGRSGRAFIAQAQGDRVIKLRDLITGDVAGVYQGAAAPLAVVHITDNGSRPLVVGGAYAGGFTVWDFDNYSLLREIESRHDWVGSCLIGSAGNRSVAVMVGFQGSLACIDVESGKQIWRLPDAQAVVANNIIELGNALAIASVSRDRSICMWNIADGSLLLRSSCRRMPRERLLSFMHDERPLVAGADSVGRCEVWDPQTNRRIATVDIGGRASCMSHAALSNSSLLFAAIGKGVRAWDLISGKPAMTYHGVGEEISACRVATIEGQRRVLAGTEGGKVVLWDMESGSIVGELDTCGAAVRSIDLGWIGRDEVIAAAGNDGCVRLWFARTLAPFSSRKVHTDWIRSIQISNIADAAIVASASDDGTVRIEKYSERGALQGGKVRFLTCEAGFDFVAAPDLTDHLTRIEREAWRYWHAEYEADGRTQTAPLEDAMALNSRSSLSP